MRCSTSWGRDEAFAQAALHAVHIHDEYVFVLRAAFRQQEIQLAQLIGEALRCLGAKIAEHPVIPGGEVELQQPGIAIGPDPLPNHHHAVTHGFGEAAAFTGRVGAVSVVKLVGAVGDHDPGGLVRIQLGGRVHGLGIDLIVVGIENIVADTGLIAPAPQSGGDVLGSAIAQNGGPNGG